MKLYNIATDKIENRKTIKTNDGTLYPNKLTDAQLNSYGYYRVKYESAPNRRYYNATKSASVVGTEYVVGYTVTEKPIEEVKGLMFNDLFDEGLKRENSAKVDTGLGFTVDGSERGLSAFALGAKKGVSRVRDENFMPHNVTVPQVNAILTAIEDNILSIFNAKEAKFDEIIALTTVAVCIEYENTPYDYVVTQEDVDIDLEGTLVLGQIITKYSNKVKEW